MKWRYSRRMIRVRCIFVDMTVPVRIRPRIETIPVKGHFLSVEHMISNRSMRERSPRYLRTSPPWTFPHFRLWGNDQELERTYVGSLNRSLWRPESKSNVLVPSSPAFAHLLALRALHLRVKEYVRLFLESPLRLHGQFGRHDCDIPSTMVLEGFACWVPWVVVDTNEFQCSLIRTLWEKLNPTG